MSRGCGPGKPLACGCCAVFVFFGFGAGWPLFMFFVCILFAALLQHLGQEDFLLLFSYAVYSSLSDTVFMYFDCSPYEDGESYLAGSL